MVNKKIIKKVRAEFDQSYKLLKGHLKLQVIGKSLLKGLDKQARPFKDLYYGQKAMQKGANNDLPFQTLVILGQLLSHPVQKERVSKVIQDNALIFKGEYLQLDDPYQQGKIRKALRSYEFESWQKTNTNKAA